MLYTISFTLLLVEGCVGAAHSPSKSRLSFKSGFQHNDNIESSSHESQRLSTVLVERICGQNWSNDTNASFSPAFAIFNQYRGGYAPQPDVKALPEENAEHRISPKTWLRYPRADSGDSNVTRGNLNERAKDQPTQNLGQNREDPSDWNRLLKGLGPVRDNEHRKFDITSRDAGCESDNLRNREKCPLPFPQNHKGSPSTGNNKIPLPNLKYENSANIFPKVNRKNGSDIASVRGILGELKLHPSTEAFPFANSEMRAAQPHNLASTVDPTAPDFSALLKFMAARPQSLDDRYNGNNCGAPTVSSQHILSERETGNCREENVDESNKPYIRTIAGICSESVDKCLEGKESKFQQTILDTKLTSSVNSNNENPIFGPSMRVTLEPEPHPLLSTVLMQGGLLYRMAADLGNDIGTHMLSKEHAAGEDHLEIEFILSSNIKSNKRVPDRFLSPYMIILREFASIERLPFRTFHEKPAKKRPTDVKKDYPLDRIFDENWRNARTQSAVRVTGYRLFKTIMSAIKIHERIYRKAQDHARDVAFKETFIANYINNLLRTLNPLNELKNDKDDKVHIFTMLRLSYYLLSPLELNEVIQFSLKPQTLIRILLEFLRYLDDTTVAKISSKYDQLERPRCPKDAQQTITIITSILNAILAIHKEEGESMGEHFAADEMEKLRCMGNLLKKFHLEELQRQTYLQRIFNLGLLTEQAMSRIVNFHKDLCNSYNNRKEIDRDETMREIYEDSKAKLKEFLNEHCKGRKTNYSSVKPFFDKDRESMDRLVGDFQFDIYEPEKLDLLKQLIDGTCAVIRTTFQELKEEANAGMKYIHSHSNVAAGLIPWDVVSSIDKVPVGDSYIKAGDTEFFQHLLHLIGFIRLSDKKNYSPDYYIPLRFERGSTFWFSQLRVLESMPFSASKVGSVMELWNDIRTFLSDWHVAVRAAIDPIQPRVRGNSWDVICEHREMKFCFLPKMDPDIDQFARFLWMAFKGPQCNDHRGKNSKGMDDNDGFEC